MSKPILSRRALILGGASAIGLGAGLGLGRLIKGPAPKRPKKENAERSPDVPPPKASSFRGPALNVLVISSDEHNASWMGNAGHPWVKTPHMDRLASEGVACDRAYAASPVCAPARQSFLTGLYSPEHGQLHNNYVLDARTRTLAHHFAEAGWSTACVGKMHTNNEHLDFGFQYRPEDTGLGENHIQRAARAVRSGRKGQVDEDDQALFRESPDKRFIGAPLDDISEIPDERITEMALNYLARDHQRPFFLYVSYLQPHYPWYIPRDFYYQYSPSDLPDPSWDPEDLQDSYYALERLRQRGWHKMSPALRRLIQARYAGGISWTDAHLGRILEALEAAGLSDNTLVVYTSDHGEMAGEKGLWLKSLMFEGAVRIPLILRLPGVLPAGQRSEVLVNQVDLFPTLAALGGAPDPQGVSGTDHSAALLGNGSGPDRTFSIEGAPRQGGRAAILMTRSDRWKLNLYRDRYGGQSRFVELFDLSQDPKETQNLALSREHASVVAQETEAAERFWEGLKVCPYEYRTEDGLGDDD